MTKKEKDLVARKQESEKPQVNEEYRALLDDLESESDEVWTKNDKRKKKVLH